jgi:hypothetical protein
MPSDDVDDDGGGGNPVMLFLRDDAMLYTVAAKRD